MTNSDETKECLKNLIGWKQHYNTEVVINDDLQKSETFEYYQDFHPALQLNIISQSLERDRDINQYLEEKVSTGITQLLNDIEQKRQANGVKDLLASETLLDKYGWANDGIYNENRFVGFMFELLDKTGLALLIQNIGLQLTIPQTGLKIYLYHSSQMDPLKVFEVDVTKAISWNWIKLDAELGSKTKDTQGGTYYIGYYQDDLLGTAINYTDFNWNRGACGSCDGNKMIKAWANIQKYASFMPMYVPNQNLSDDRFMFDERAVMVDPNKSWGINFKLSVVCELSDFFCSNRRNLKTALGLKVTYLILTDIKFSQQFNYINEDIKNLIIRDLEGDKDTYNFGIAAKLSKEINNVYLDTSGLNKYCLPCSDKGGIDSYGAA